MGGKRFSSCNWVSLTLPPKKKHWPWCLASQFRFWSRKYQVIDLLHIVNTTPFFETKTPPVYPFFSKKFPPSGERIFSSRKNVFGNVQVFVHFKIMFSHQHISHTLQEGRLWISMVFTLRGTPSLPIIDFEVGGGGLLRWVFVSKNGVVFAMCNRSIT